MNLTGSCKFSVPEHVHFVIFEAKDGFPSSLTLLNFESGEFYALDTVGLDFWCLVQEKKETSLEEIINVLISKYNINKERLWIDIEELVEILVEKDIITLLEH